MFNEQQKMDFIDDYIQTIDTKEETNLRQLLITFFHRLGKIEEDFGDDFANYDYESLVLAVNSLCTGGASYQANVLSRLRLYLDWCILNGRSKQVENYLDGITVANLDVSAAYRITMLKDEQQLLQYMEMGFDPLEQGTIDTLYRVYCLLLFQGITARETVEIKMQDVNLATGTIAVGEKVFSLSAATKKAVEQLSRLEGYYFQKQGKYFRSKADTGHLLEFTSDCRDHILQYYRSRLSKFNKDLQKNLRKNVSFSTTNIFKSGIFYRIYQQECQTGTRDFSEYVARYANQKRNETLRKNQGEKEYVNWQKAFYF